MIDFRYHLVSLISVFLALAVGIALGAGPLKESIGNTLTGQVDQLRTEKDQLRAEADHLSSNLADSRDAISALTPSVLEGVLGGRRVAVVTLGEVDSAVVDSVGAAIQQAGGAVTAVADVTAAWTDPTRTAFRQSLAGTMITYLDPAPAQDAGADVELAEALAQGLSSTSPTDPNALSENAGVLLDLLTGDSGLVTVTSPVTQPADAVVVLAGPITPVDEAVPTLAPTATPSGSASPRPTPTETASPTDSASRKARLDAWAAISQAVQRRSAGAVVVTGEVADDSLVRTIRTDDALSKLLTTVDGVRTPQGLLAVPLGLADRIAGVVGQYGAGPQATAAMPDRTALPPIERVAAQPPAEPSPSPTESAASTGQG
ncbi:copper transporter [Isoptericola sp. b441]|uniref:Copper transporter n=1 Tax=Actinotalea lenta TaxID=3064654 RepID=A0ABT9DB22_9CELL|nr:MULTISPECIES: copper transporter [unclassified Isoptericola]MDO8107484.1 copper transporter [Isoptericola sp. b441]MDO8120856.1 copper transporter [Isoptericola sp. b490]